MLDFTVKAPSVQAPTATQYSCQNCADRQFYIMLQPNGDIEVFCHLNNHRQTLVNISKLVASIFDDSLDPKLESDIQSADRSGDPSFNS